MSVNPVPRTKRAWIVVLGDVGRSPRMQNHAKSFAENGNLVEIIGYVDNKVNEEIATDPRINVNKMTSFPDLQLPRLLKYIFKIFWSILSLLSIFLSVKKADLLMLQNPPGVPALCLCYMYCKIVKAKFIIDWHNYTWSIMALDSSPQSTIVKIARQFEFYFGRKSDLNFCVTEGMRRDLWETWDIEATVLYDRAPDKFHPIDLEKKHEFMRKLVWVYKELYVAQNTFYEEMSILTTKSHKGKIELREDRPGVIVSSTSWTSDEDFQILLDALIQYNAKAKLLLNKYREEEIRKLPNLLCIITGKGPQKEMYQAKIDKLNLEYVTIMTPWLKSDEYPLILACADLGVCLHKSSSGLDLPMKIVDMFGCGLPVCAMNFNCIPELVEHGKNGFVFSNANELCLQLIDWFYCFPGQLMKKDKVMVRNNVQKFQELGWSENWRNVVLSRL